MLNLDHPVIENMERTGYPDGEEPVTYRCPVCRDCIYHGNYLYTIEGEVLGCEFCVSSIPPEGLSAEGYPME